MKIIFAGTPEFAAVALDSLIRAGHDVALVLTQPDRPAGRGLKAHASAVKAYALSRGLRIEQPAGLRDAGAVALVSSVGADAMIVAAYGLILPKTLLEVPRLGCLNIHASLLPRWRGAAPIQRAILAGDRETGITIMQMDAGLDTGPVLLREAISITSDDTTRTLHDRLATLGGKLIVNALAQPLEPVPQNESLATYAAKISRQEAKIDWSRTAAEIHRQIRAFNPAPGAYSELSGMVVKIWCAEPMPGLAAAPGTVAEVGADGIVIGCGTDGLRLLELQRAGGKRLAASAFLSGFPILPGARFG